MLVRMAITSSVASAADISVRAESTPSATAVAVLSATEMNTICVRRAVGIFAAEITLYLSADTRLAMAEATTRVMFAANISA